MNLFHFRSVIASRKAWQAAGVSVFQGKPENISRMKGSTTVFWTTPRSWLELKWKSAKKLRKTFYYSTRSLLIWFLARPHQQLLCTVRLSHGAQPSWTNPSTALLKYSRNIQEFRSSDTGSQERYPGKNFKQMYHFAPVLKATELVGGLGHIKQRRGWELGSFSQGNADGDPTAFLDY